VLLKKSYDDARALIDNRFIVEIEENALTVRSVAAVNMNSSSLMYPLKFISEDLVSFKESLRINDFGTQVAQFMLNSENAKFIKF